MSSLTFIVIYFFWRKKIGRKRHTVQFDIIQLTHRTVIDSVKECECKVNYTVIFVHLKRFTRQKQKEKKKIILQYCITFQVGKPSEALISPTKHHFSAFISLMRTSHRRKVKMQLCHLHFHIWTFDGQIDK